MERGSYFSSAICPLLASFLSIMVLLSLLSLPNTGDASVRCRVNATPLNFGKYNEYRPRNANGTVSLTCRRVGRGPKIESRLVSYQVSLSRGHSHSYYQRHMREISGKHTLRYNIYLDSGRRIVWGDGSQGTGVASGTVRVLRLKPTRERVRMYGRMPARQNAWAGMYMDVVRVNVNF